MFQFAWPWMFALLPLPWLLRRLLPAQPQGGDALYLPFAARMVAMQSEPPSPATSRLGLASLWLIWLCLLLAAARPQWVGEAEQLPATGRDLMVAVDISGSMSTEDMRWNDQAAPRIEVVKHLLGNFLAAREGDRVGLILFGERAYLQAPLTFDGKTVKTLLQEAQIGFAGKATAIGDAIGLAIKKLQARPQPARVLLLLTDDANTAGQISPEQAAGLAERSQLRIYTIGIGADEMIQPGLFGSGLGAQRVNPSADLDEDLLKLIAQRTGGRYFRARSSEQLHEIYQELDKLEPLKQAGSRVRPTTEWFHWPLGLGLLLSLLACAAALFPRQPRASA